jgi:hypothetical protein
VYSYLSAISFGTPASSTEMIVGFGAAALVCGVATLLPIELARRRLEKLER